MSFAGSGSASSSARPGIAAADPRTVPVLSSSIGLAVRPSTQHAHRRAALPTRSPLSSSSSTAATNFAPREWFSRPESRNPATRTTRPPPPRLKVLSVADSPATEVAADTGSDQGQPPAFATSQTHVVRGFGAGSSAGCLDDDHATTDRILAEDRDRHRRELDAVWQRERDATAQVAAFKAKVGDLQRRDRELRCQLLSLREHAARVAIEREASDVLAQVTARVVSEVMRFAAAHSAQRPPVRDSELLRALRRAEQRVAVLERRHGVPGGGNSAANNFKVAGVGASAAVRAATCARRGDWMAAPAASPIGKGDGHNNTHDDDGEDDILFRRPVDPRRRFRVTAATVEALLATDSDHEPFRPVIVH